MNKKDELFPRFQKGIENLIEDEEGNIPGRKLLVLGTMIVVLGSLMAMDGEHPKVCVNHQTDVR